MVVNGREYEWASLFARLDQHMLAQERREMAILRYQERMEQAFIELPGRIASAISVSPAPAAHTGPASKLKGWTELVEALGSVLLLLVPVMGLLLLVRGSVTVDQLAALPLISHR